VDSRKAGSIYGAAHIQFAKIQVANDRSFMFVKGMQLEVQVDRQLIVPR